MVKLGTCRKQPAYSAKGKVRVVAGVQRRMTHLTNPAA